MRFSQKTPQVIPRKGAEMHYLSLEKLDEHI